MTKNYRDKIQQLTINIFETHTKHKTKISLIVSLIFLLTLELNVLLFYYIISLLFERELIMIIHHLVAIWYLTGGYEERVLYSAILFKIADIFLYLAKLTNNWLMWLLSILSWVVLRIIMFTLLWPLVNLNIDINSDVYWINNTIGLGLLLVNIYWLKNLAKKFNDSFITFIGK